MKRKSLFLIDGNSFCYRAFYAIKGLSNSKGQPTNAIYGFISMLNKIKEKEKPDYLAVSFDLKGPTFRHEKFKDYKIHRKPMPDDLQSQIPIIKDVLRAYNIPIIEKQGYEADDVLATVAEKARDRFDVYIVTGDKDALQLVKPHVSVLDTKTEGLVYDEEKVKERFGFGPEAVVDFMALAGDATDNIPGVKGIGEKTAKELLDQFKTLDGIYKNLDDVKSESVKKLLKEQKEQAVMSKELAKVDADAPVDFDIDEMKIKEPDAQALAGLFKELEFKTLLKEVAPQKNIELEVINIKTKDEIKSLVDEIKKIGSFAFDLESAVAVCVKPKKVYLVDKIDDLFEDEDIEKVGFDLKKSALALKNNKVELRGENFDIMVASYLLNPERQSQDLSDIAFEYLGYGIHDQASEEEVITSRCDCILRLHDILEKALKEKDLYGLFRDIEMPLVSVLARMELNGVSIDAPYLKKLSDEMEKKLEKLTRDIYETAGTEFNINSPKQLGEVLFTKLGLPVVKRTKTGPSTNVEVLEKLSTTHALPAMILQYRELAKLKSTYVDALPLLINEKTKRVHASFNQTITATGRLSSSEPNLQNIPIKTQEGKKIRKAFVPQKSNDFILSADYSQIELRILAHLSEDENLKNAFKKDLDIHTYTASLIFNIKEQDVTPEQRSAAKTVNFGIVYGMSPFGLSKGLGISPGEAESFIDAYFQRYPEVKKYMQKQIEHARKHGFVTTLFKRRRYIQEINSSNNTVKSFAERMAINAPIQGSAADLIKVAMIDIQKELDDKKLDSKMIMQVHDELVFEVPQDELDDVTKIVKNKMEKAVQISVPIKVKISKGKNWLETE